MNTATPTPAPVITPTPVISISPAATPAAMPTPTPVETALIVSTTDPAVWTVDTQIAFWGLIVAAIGAIATTLIAGWGLAATIRANRAETAERALQAEAQVRANRLNLRIAVDEYLAAWKPDWRWGNERTASEVAERRLRAVAAGVSLDAEAVADWVIHELGVTVDQLVEEYRAWDDSNLSIRMVEMGALGMRSEVGRRVLAWVSTGVLDQSPLIAPTPAPATFGERA